MYVVEAGLLGKEGDAGIVIALAVFTGPFYPLAELRHSCLTLGTRSAVTDLGNVCKLSQEGAQS